MVLIFGIAGALRREEITNMTLDQIKEEDKILIVNVPCTKTSIDRIFTVSANTFFDPIQIYKRYLNLCPKNCTHLRFL